MGRHFLTSLPEEFFLDDSGRQENKWLTFTTNHQLFPYYQRYAFIGFNVHFIIILKCNGLQFPQTHF